MLWRKPLVVLWLIGPEFVVAGCDSPTAQRQISPRAIASTAAPGWVRYSYGSISVEVPSTWKLRHSALPGCSSPPADTVNEATVSRVLIYSCPAETTGTPPVPWVAVQCLVEKANRLYSGGEPFGKKGSLRRQGEVVFLPAVHTEGVVIADGPASLVERVLMTVKATGYLC